MQQEESLFRDPEPRNNDSRQNEYRHQDGIGAKPESLGRDPAQPYAVPDATRAEQHDRGTYNEYSDGYARAYDGPSEAPYEQPWPYRPENEKLHPREQQRPLSRRHSPLRFLIPIGIIFILLFIFGSTIPHWYQYPNPNSFPKVSMMHQSPMTTRSFNVGAQPHIVLNFANNDVSIHSGNTDTVTVAAGKDLLDNISMEQSGDTLTVTSSNHSMFDWSGSNLDITVPSSSSVEVHDGTGDTTISDVNGPVAVTSASGNIRVNNVRGQLTLNTASGDIIVDTAHITGNSTFTTVSGDINVGGTFDAQGSYHAKTVSGNVSVVTMSDINVQTKTISGSVSNAFGDNTSGPTLSINTVSGNININKG